MRGVVLGCLSMFLLAGCASETTYNGDIDKLANVPDHGHVRVMGDVGEVFGPDEFVLRDTSGSVEVFSADDTPMVHHGEHVAVEGDVTSSTFANILGDRKDIDATSVEVLNDKN